MTNFFDFYNLGIKYKKSSANFAVKEESLYPFDGSGEYIVLSVQKKNLSTWDMVQIFSEHIGVKIRDIGYAGLKDKNGTTVQNISMDKKYEDRINSFYHEHIKILSSSYHGNKLRVGHLKGNHFSILLDDIKYFDMLKDRIETISKWGIPNYFGFQRFGLDKENFLIGKDIVSGAKKIRAKHKSKLFISAYQSYLFNNWLDDRVKMSKTNTNTEQTHPFKLFDGEIYLHYPYGKIFQSEIKEEERFLNQDIAPTGLLAGEKVSKSSGEAYIFEEKIDIINSTTSKLPKKQMLGSRRFAWIFPSELTIIEENDKLKITFFLPKGSYATVLLEQLGIL